MDLDERYSLAMLIVIDRKVLSHDTSFEGDFGRGFKHGVSWSGNVYCIQEYMPGERSLEEE